MLIAIFAEGAARNYHPTGKDISTAIAYKLISAIECRKSAGVSVRHSRDGWDGSSAGHVVLAGLRSRETATTYCAVTM
jgi:hypothetical protein